MKLKTSVTTEDGQFVARMGRNVLAKKGIVPEGKGQTKKDAQAELAKALVLLDVIVCSDSLKSGPKVKAPEPVVPPALLEPEAPQA